MTHLKGSMIYVIIAGTDRKVKIWESGMTGIDLRQTLTGSNGSILCLDFDTPGTHILAASSDFACRVWTVDDGRLRVSPNVSSQYFPVLFLSRDA